MTQLKRSLLATTIAMSLSFAAEAAYNIYNKEGLSLDLNGRVDAQYRHDTGKTTTVSPDVSNEQINADRRSRLGYGSGSSWLQIRGQQQITPDLKATGTISVAYYKPYYGNADTLYLNQANAALEYKNWGSVAVGKQFLHSSYVTRTNTFYPLDYYSNASIRGDFTYFPDLTLSAYYLFPENSDTRNTSDYEADKGYGVSGEYTFRFSPEHTLRTALGYTYSTRNPSTTNTDSYTKKDAVAGSLEYIIRDWTFAFDAGYENYKNRTVISNVKAYSYGFKTEYAFTPKFRFTVGYGIKNVHRDRTQSDYVVQGTNTDGSTYTDIWYFDRQPKSKLHKYYTSLEYDLHDNVTLYAQLELLRDKHKHNAQNTQIKDKTNTVKAGLVINF